MLGRRTLSHANNLRKRYGDYERKKYERRGDHVMIAGASGGYAGII